MKKILLIVLLLVSFYTKAQDIIPSGTVNIPTFSIRYDVPSLNPILYKGSTYGFTILATHKNMRAAIDTLKLLKQNNLYGTGFVKAAGSTITYDNNSYWYSGSHPTTLSGYGITETPWTGLGYITSSALSPYRQLNNHDSLSTLDEKSYNSLTNKPTLFSGAYSDLTGKPSLFSGSYTDLTNKPSLFSGAYSDLTGKPSLFDGAWSSLTGRPSIPYYTSDLTNNSGFITSSSLSPYRLLNNHDSLSTLDEKSYNSLTDKPSIPAAQINSDWNAGSGVARILNKPSIPAAQINSDWNASSGVAAILNKPSLFDGAWSSLTGRPSIPYYTSDLTNNSGFITASALSGYITHTPFNAGGIMFRGDESYGVIANNSANWNTAYGWGNHASAGYAPASRTISTTSPLTGGGDLSTNRTIAISEATQSSAGSMSAADKTKLDGLSSTVQISEYSVMVTDISGMYGASRRDDILTVTLPSSGTWEFTANIIAGYSGNNTQTYYGVKYNQYGYVRAGIVGNVGTTGMISKYLNAMDTDYGEFTTSSSSDGVIRITGLYTITSSTTLIIYRMNANGGYAAPILAGSFLKATKASTYVPEP